MIVSKDNIMIFKNKNKFKVVSIDPGLEKVIGSFDTIEEAKQFGNKLIDDYELDDNESLYIKQNDKFVYDFPEMININNMEIN